MPNCTSPADLSLAFNSVITIVLILEILSPSHLCFHCRSFLESPQLSRSQIKYCIIFLQMDSSTACFCSFKPFYRSVSQTKTLSPFLMFSFPSPSLHIRHQVLLFIPSKWFPYFLLSVAGLPIITPNLSLKLQFLIFWLRFCLLPGLSS